MSDTPETDKQSWWNHSAGKIELCPADFARKLERECNELREIFPKILEALESGSCAATCSVDFLREIPREVRFVRQRLDRELAAVRSELASASSSNTRVS